MRQDIKTKNVGTVEGSLLVFGGPYSNLQALEAMYNFAQNKKIKPSNIICTGDIVGYCAKPDECVQFVKSWGIHCIAGNVELNLRNESDDCGCNFDEGSRCDLFSKQWFPFAQKNIGKKSLEYLHSLPHFLSFKYANKKVFVVHGSYFNTSEFIFKSTPWQIKKQNFEATQSDVILAGHAGLPFYQNKNNKHWFNTGVIGMPANDGNAHTWFLILNQQLHHQFHHLHYDHQTANTQMLKANLPPTYAQTLLNGIWDNCEILPNAETAQQGKELIF